MPRRKKGTPPPYLHHQASGQAYSVWRGKQYYHGPWNSPASKRKYAARIAEWAETQGIVPDVDPGTIEELCRDYQKEVASHLSKDEQRSFRANLRDVVSSYGALAPEEFGPRQLKSLREDWIKEGNARQTVNKKLGRVRRVFRWALSEERIPAAVLTALESVDDLRSGRTEAPDYSEVLAVPLRDFARTLRQLDPVTRAMARVQYYTGARPGEVCRMKASELHRGQVKVAGRTVQLKDGAWAFTPSRHKNKGKKKSLVYAVGPRVQRILLPFLGNEILFSKSTREPRRARRPDNYAQDIAEACTAAGVDPWSPNQIRHNWFTRMDRLAGIVATSSAGGHSSLSTSAIYIERNIQQAAQLARRYG